jgi:hypothetical protein
MTEGCPVSHDGNGQTDRGPQYINTRAALRRLNAGEDPEDVFQHSVRCKLTTSDLAWRGQKSSQKERANTLLTAGATDIASNMSQLPLGRPCDIPNLEEGYLPLNDKTMATSGTLSYVVMPTVHFIINHEAEKIINHWRKHPQQGEITEDIIKQLMRGDFWNKQKQGREFIGEQLAVNLRTATNLIPPYLRVLIQIYAQQIQTVDPALAEAYPYPSVTMFQGLMQESAGLLLSQAARNDQYLGIMQNNIPVFNTNYDSENEDVRLQLKKRPNGRFRVSLTPQTRKAIEAQFDKETVPDQIITGCPAMPLIQAMLQRVDSYIEAFKEE